MSCSNFSAISLAVRRARLITNGCGLSVLPSGLAHISMSSIWGAVHSGCIPVGCRSAMCRLRWGRSLSWKVHTTCRVSHGYARRMGEPMWIKTAPPGISDGIRWKLAILTAASGKRRILRWAMSSSSRCTRCTPRLRICRIGGGLVVTSASNRRQNRLTNGG